MLDRRTLHLLAAGIVAALAAITSAACGPPGPLAATRPSASSPPASRRAVPGFDECEKSPPVARAYDGIGRGARCEQQLYLHMAYMSQELGVECRYCHVVSAEDPRKEDYPVMTPRKEIANWMSVHLMSAVKPADGSPMQCKSCHTDESGKPVVKILGDPRDPLKANEWMSLVMVNRFVAADGSRLKCRSCHAGTPGSKEWQPKVILRSEQIPKHEVGAGPAF